MNQIISTIKLENININILQKFIEHWREIKDLPCSDLEYKKLNESTLVLKLFYPLDVFDRTVTQFLTILFGEISFITSFGKVKFLDLQLPNEIYNWFSGPKFGADELKVRFKIEKFPMLVAIIKPSISSDLNIEKIEEKIKKVLNSGFHGIKDDEMQANLLKSSLNERLKLARKYKKYIPAINLDNINEYKKAISSNKSKDMGMILINASTIGLPMLHEIKKITKTPILSHVAMQGVFNSSFTPKLFAKLHRLFGCDAFTTPISNTNYFNISKEDEKEMINEFTKELPVKKTLPLLIGGARLNNLIEIIQPYKKMGILFGIAFGSLIFSSNEPSEKMCQKTIDEINKFYPS